MPGVPYSRTPEEGPGLTSPDFCIGKREGGLSGLDFLLLPEKSSEQETSGKVKQLH